MNKKMHALARNGRCAGRGGANCTLGRAAAAVPLKKPSCSSNAVKASPVKPAPACQRNWRRVPVQSGRDWPGELIRATASCYTPTREDGKHRSLVREALTPSWEEIRGD